MPKEPAIPTRNVVLTDQQVSMIEKLVRSGRYQNASEVLRDGLRLIESKVVRETVEVEARRANLIVDDPAQLADGPCDAG